MKKKLKSFIGLVICFIFVGCNVSEESDIDLTQLEKIEVRQSSSGIIEGPFSFRVVSEKEVYEVGEEVKMYGELRYNGEKDAISITTGGSAINFYIKEKIRNKHVVNITEDIAIMRELEKNNPIKVQYVKNSFYLEGEDKGNHLFMEEFHNEDGFPTGYYIVKGVAEFVANIDGENKTIRLETDIDFKVVQD